MFIVRSGYKSAAEAGSMAAALKQLEGKVVGSPTRGSIHDVILRYFLSKEGMADKVEIRNFAWTDFVGAAMEAGEIDAAVGTPSLQVSLSLVSGVDVKPIASPHDLWPHNPSYGIVATEDFMSRHPDRLIKFLEAHMESISFMKQKPEEAARVAAEVVGVVGPEFFRECYGVSPRYCAALSEDFIVSTMRFVGALEEQGYIPHAVERDEIFDPSFIKKIHPAANHYGEPGAACV